MNVARTSSNNGAMKVGAGSRQPHPTFARFVGGKALLIDKNQLDKLAGKDADHVPVLFSAGAGAHRIDALSWNVCFRYAGDAKKNRINNGFGRLDESAEHYQARLVRTAAHVEAMVKAAKPPVVFLQETPRAGDPMHALFCKELQARLTGYSVVTSGDRIALIRGNAQKLALPEMPRQGSRVDAFLLEKPKCIAMNAHLEWDKHGSEDELDTRDELHDAVAHLKARFPGVPILLAGDLNRVPSGRVSASEPGGRIDTIAAGLGQIIEPPGPTSLRFNLASAKPEMTWADYAVYIAP